MSKNVSTPTSASALYNVETDPERALEAKPRTRAFLSRRLKVLTIPIRTEQKGDDVVGATEAEVHHIGRDIV